MSGCSAVKGKFTEYLDGRLNGREMQLVAAHLDECGNCSEEWLSLRQTQASLAVLGPVPEPADLLLRIRVAVSQERARSRRSVFEDWSLAWKGNTVGPFLLQAGAGFASACLLLGSIIVLITMFTQPEVAAGQQGRTAWESDGAAAGESIERCERRPDWRSLRAGSSRGFHQRRGQDVRLSHRVRP